jgi:hypothetical protein
MNYKEFISEQNCFRRKTTKLKVPASKVNFQEIDRSLKFELTQFKTVLNCPKEALSLVVEHLLDHANRQDMLGIMNQMGQCDMILDDRMHLGLTRFVLDYFCYVMNYQNKAVNYMKLCPEMRQTDVRHLYARFCKVVQRRLQDKTEFLDKNFCRSQDGKFCKTC